MTADFESKGPVREDQGTPLSRRMSWITGPLSPRWSWPRWWISYGDRSLKRSKDEIGKSRLKTASYSTETQVRSEETLLNTTAVSWAGLMLQGESALTPGLALCLLEAVCACFGLTASASQALICTMGIVLPQTINEIKRQPSKLEKILANHVLNNIGHPDSLIRWPISSVQPRGWFRVWRENPEGRTLGREAPESVHGPPQVGREGKRC